MPSAPFADRHHLPIKVGRHQVSPCLVHEPGFDKGRNDMPVPIDVRIEFGASGPMPPILARADLTRHGFDIAPMCRHARQISREHAAQPRQSAARSSARTQPGLCQPGEPAQRIGRAWALYAQLVRLVVFDAATLAQ
jgi:hypothetical protein